MPRATTSPAAATWNSTGAASSCRRFRQLTEVERLDQRGQRRQSEVRRKRGEQRGRRTTTVVGAGRRPERLLGQLRPTTPIAGQLAQRREPSGPPVRQHPGAVDPRTTHHRDTPRFVHTRTQQGKRVIGDVHRLRPAARLEGGGQPLAPRSACPRSPGTPRSAAPAAPSRAADRPPRPQPRTSGSKPATAASGPTFCGSNPPPRAVPRTVPSAATRATSVLLFPASKASTPPGTITPMAGTPGCAPGACPSVRARWRSARPADAPAEP